MSLKIPMSQKMEKQPCHKIAFLCKKIDNHEKVPRLNKLNRIADTADG